jgi:dTDP-4-dehydrorhamnose 3,5-epimerase
MTITETSLKGSYIIEPKVFEDKVRGGFFMENFKSHVLLEHGISVNWIQENHSQSTKGVIRGLHFQKPPFAQDKLCRVVRGEALDVFVDLRKGSPTYGEWESVVLSEDNKKQVLVPKGFAHGFVALSDKVDFIYIISNKYSTESEGGLLWNDPKLNIDWKTDKPILVDRDLQWPTLDNLESPF